MKGKYLFYVKLVCGHGQLVLNIIKLNTVKKLLNKFSCDNLPFKIVQNCHYQINILLTQVHKATVKRILLSIDKDFLPNPHK